jgi:hypothetical protein
MKTKELIRQLMEQDPSGEEECCVENQDIDFVHREFAFFDGPFQKYIRDENGQITGAEYVKTGDKIQITTNPIRDLFWDTEVVINYQKLGDEALAERYKISDEKTRDFYKKMHKNHEFELFFSWVKQQAQQIAGDKIPESVVKKFFDKEIDFLTPLPTEKTEEEKSGKCAMSSYSDRRKMQWDRLYQIEFDGISWLILKKQ